MKTIIYTAICGDYDTVKDQPITVRLYTDKDSKLPELHPRMRAKYFKCNPHEFLDCDVSVWIDGSAEILTKDFRKWAIDQLGDGDIALFKHPIRDCIYEEAKVSIEMPKYSGLPIYEQVEAYRGLGHPEGFGLWACGMLIRRHNKKVEEFNKNWWNENLKWTYQDQLSFPICSKDLDIRTIELDIFDNEIINFNNPHRSLL